MKLTFVTFARFDDLCALIFGRGVQAGVRAASQAVRDAVLPEQSQPTYELCLLAHGIMCTRCKL